MHPALLQALQHLHGEGHHQGDEPVGLAGGVLGHPHQLRGDLRQRQAGEGGVQQGVEHLQLGLRQIGGQADEPVAHHVGVGHHHNDEGVVLHHQQVKAPDGHLVHAGGEGEGGVVGQPGHHPARLVQHPVQLLHLQAQGLVHALGLLQGELVLLHQLVDVEPVALGRGDAPGGGVGLLQQAHGLQIRHVVADGGRGDLHTDAVGNGLGAYRLRRLDIALDDGAENPFFPFSQIHSGHPFIVLALILLEC